ncbi:hypothetical protein [uncultured Paludibaculum sp.]|uniref:hypothetical protein n=1 Tax=uncultured Paludibaculum sp. TaxID=1765020 RepID=UPI002AAAB760|nr:hypothetical protein [uncultured Paludibaculum sp.]
MFELDFRFRTDRSTWTGTQYFGICHVTCKKSEKNEIWLKPDKNTPERFHIRIGPSSTEPLPRDAVEYIKDHITHDRK